MATGNDARSHWQRLELIQQSDFTAQQKLLLVWLWKYGGDDGRAWPRQADLCAAMSIGDRQLRRLLKALDDVVTVGRNGTRNLYTVDWEAVANRTPVSAMNKSEPDIEDRYTGHTGPVNRTPVSAMNGSKPDTEDRSYRTPASGSSLYTNSKKLHVKNPPTPLGESDRQPEQAEDGGGTVQAGTLASTALDSRRADIDQPDEEILLLAAWAAAEGRKEYPHAQLYHARRRDLLARLDDPGWDWRAALAKFPLQAFQRPDGFLPTIGWFLEDGRVESILEGRYDFRFGANSDRQPKPADKMASARRLLARRSADTERIAERITE